MLKYKGNPELCVVLLLFGSLGAIAGFGANRLLQGAGRLAIYETDLDQGTPIVSLYVNFPQQGTEQEKVQELASLLSQRKFCELPINVVAFKDKIVTIDLEEHPWNEPLSQPPTTEGCSGKTWRYQYFQGSTGGHDTSVSLARTLLQPDYQGDWIQGVKFSYEGKPIEAGQWDHLELDGVITRKNTP
jgi:hypothetical protein